MVVAVETDTPLLAADADEAAAADCNFDNCSDGDEEEAFEAAFIVIADGLCEVLAGFVVNVAAVAEVAAPPAEEAPPHRSGEVGSKAFKPWRNRELVPLLLPLLLPLMLPLLLLPPPLFWMLADACWAPADD